MKLSRSTRPLCFTRQRQVITYVIRLCDGGERKFDLQSREKGHVLMDALCSSLGLLDPEVHYFGLRFTDRHSVTRWLALNKSLRCQVGDGSTVLQFAVRFYSLNPEYLKEEAARYYFFAQVRQDIKYSRCPIACHTLAEICAYAVQAELGDYDPSVHKKNYVSQFRFVQNQTAQLEKEVAENHCRLRGRTPADMEFHFLRRAKDLNGYGLCLHKCKTVGSLRQSVDVGASARGLFLFSGSVQIGYFPWARVKRLKYRRSHLTIDVTDRMRSESLVFLLELSSRRECSLLWKQLIEQHSFFEREMSNSAGSKHSFRKCKEHAKSEVVQSLFQKLPTSPVDRTPTNTFVRRHSSFEAFQRNPPSCASPDYSFEDQRHFNGGNLSPSYVHTTESQLDDTGQVSIVLTDHSDNWLGNPVVLPQIIESSSYNVSVTNPHTDKTTSGSSSTLPSPRLQPLISLKSKTALARTRSHGLIGQEDTLSLYEYQKKANQNKWHRSKHQQQLEKLLDEYERHSSQSTSSRTSLGHRRSLSHEGLQTSKFRSKSSFKQSLFRWKKGRKTLSLSGGISSCEKYYSDDTNCTMAVRDTRFNGTISIDDSQGSLEEENRNPKWLSTDDIFEDDSVFTEADDHSSSLPVDSPLNDCSGDLSTRRCSDTESDGSNRHSSNQDLSFDDLI